MFYIEMLFSTHEKGGMLKLFTNFSEIVRKKSKQPHKTLFDKLHGHLTDRGSFEKRRRNYGNRMDEERRNIFQNSLIQKT